MRIILAERIKHARIAKGKTQEEMAYLIGITRATYGYYENGKVLPPVDKLVKLAKYFHVSLDHLVGIDDDQKAIAEKIIELSNMMLSSTNIYMDTLKQLTGENTNEENK